MPSTAVTLTLVSQWKAMTSLNCSHLYGKVRSPGGLSSYHRSHNYVPTEARKSQPSDVSKLTEPSQQQKAAPADRYEATVLRKICSPIINVLPDTGTSTVYLCKKGTGVGYS